MSFMQFVMAIDRTGGSGSQARWGSLTETHRSSPFANNHLQSALVSYGLNPPRCSNKSIPCQSTEGPSFGLEMVKHGETMTRMTCACRQGIPAV
jgi:hypothetical protein